MQASVETPVVLPPAWRALDVRFSGSGSEYFRIWAVNLLLILLTCGLYLPFAKMRRIRYVYANTLIDGEALAFHGDVWKMFRGFVLLAVLLGAYTLASNFSPVAALPAFVLLCLVWPALWRASMQFRLGNTSWRGLRLGFEGSLVSAYLAHLPVYVPTALLVAFTPEGKGPSADPGFNTEFWAGVMLLVAGLMWPWSTALLRRYQHRGYRIVGERSEVLLHTRSVYFIGFKALMLFVAAVFFSWLAAIPLSGLLAWLNGEGKIWSRYIGLIGVALSYLLGAGGVLPYFASRIQNLVWGNTRSQALQFRSELSGLVTLTLKNWLLILLTLGLYRPFAVMATTRLRLEALRIETTTDPATWAAPLANQRTDASGEVAGDLFGVDMGL